MDFEKLVPFIKKALADNGVSPEEVAQILQEKTHTNETDQNTETVDSEMVDKSNPQSADVSNEEGKMLENTFGELDVEEAIEQAKERKTYDDPATTTDGASVKIGSYWDLLKSRYGNDSR